MYQLITDWNRPDRFQETKRGEKYHSDWGRYAIANGFDAQHMDHQNQINLNTAFFFDQQWVAEEDTESFLKDSSNQSKNRIKVVKNFIKPTILQYMGNAIIMDMTIRANSTSPKASNRREEQLSELMFYTDVANNSTQDFGNFLRSKLPIGNTPEETEQMFDNMYVDEFIQGMNYFMEHISEENDFKSKKLVASFDLTRSGIGLMEYYVHNNEFKWRRVLPEQYFFDRTAQERDLSDAGFMGKYVEMVPSTIFERWTGLSDDDKRTIEEESHRTSNLNYKNNPYINNVNGKIYVYTAYWKDFEDQQYGYVIDEFDYPYLARINYVYPNQKEPRFTDKDLIPEANLNDDQKKILRGKNKATIPVDVMRYIDFIPHELVPAQQRSSIDERRDIILEYGIYPHQDTENEKVDNVSYPIKAITWMYHKGFVDTPVSSLINPQRMINRYASVEEQQISSSHGKSFFYEKQIIDNDGGEDEMLNNMYQGKPTGVNTKGLGINNMMGEFGKTIGNETLVYENLQQLMKNSMDSIVGLNDTMRGETQGANKLVGVTQLEIQRSSLIQEPFYEALANLFLQAYQATANIGKRVYVANRRKMAIAVGDRYSKVIQLTEEYNAEDFRTYIQREPDMKKQIMAANEFLFFLKDKDLIDDVRFGDLFNSSTMDEIAIAVRSYSREKMVMARDQSAIEAERSDAAAIDEETQRQEIREDGALNKAADVADKEGDRVLRDKMNTDKLRSNERVKQNSPNRGVKQNA